MEGWKERGQEGGSGSEGGQESVREGDVQRC